MYNHWSLVIVLVVPADDTQELEQRRGVAGNTKVRPRQVVELLDHTNVLVAILTTRQCRASPLGMIYIQLVSQKYVCSSQHEEQTWSVSRIH